MVSRLRSTSGLPAPVLFVAGGASMYVGAAVAVLLFDRISPAGVAWLRLLGAAAVLLAWRRPGWAVWRGDAAQRSSTPWRGDAAQRSSTPWRGDAAQRSSTPWRGDAAQRSSTPWRGRRVLLAGAFGITTALMNVVFYEAIARLPLGTAVAVEFLGPVLVAALGSRTTRDWAALGLAVAGVVLIADVRLAGSPAGVGFALLAATCWAGYIVLGARVSRAGSGAGDGIDDLTVGFVVAVVVLSPLALTTGPAFASPGLLVLGIGVGVLSSVVPYVLDQVVLRRVGRGRFALLLALLPTTATVIGFVALAQVPRPAEAVGIAAVVVAVALRREAPD